MLSKGNRRAGPDNLDGMKQLRLGRHHGNRPFLNSRRTVQLQQPIGIAMSDFFPIRGDTGRLCRNCVPASLELKGQSTENRIRSAPKVISAAINGGSEKKPLVVIQTWSRIV